MAREHIKLMTIGLIERHLNGRIERATGMTDALRMQIEALKAKTLHVAHQQPADFYESVWVADDAATIRTALAKLQPLVEAAP